MKPTTNPLFHNPKDDGPQVEAGSGSKGLLIALGIEIVIVLAVIGFCKYKGLL